MADLEFHWRLSALGPIKLQKLTTERVQEFCAQKQNEGYKPKTIVLIHSVLSSALENAVRNLAIGCWLFQTFDEARLSLAKRAFPRGGR